MKKFSEFIAEDGWEGTGWNSIGSTDSRSADRDDDDRRRRIRRDDKKHNVNPDVTPDVTPSRRDRAIRKPLSPEAAKEKAQRAAKKRRHENSVHDAFGPGDKKRAEDVPYNDQPGIKHWGNHVFKMDRDERPHDNNTSREIMKAHKAKFHKSKNHDHAFTLPKRHAASFKRKMASQGVRLITHHNYDPDKDKTGRDHDRKILLSTHKKTKSIIPPGGKKPVRESMMKKFSEFVAEATPQKGHSLWKHNPRSGYWDHQRAVTPETQDQWLSHFQKDEPGAHFVVSKHKPKHNPTSK